MSDDGVDFKCPTLLTEMRDIFETNRPPHRWRAMRRRTAPNELENTVANEGKRFDAVDDAGGRQQAGQ